MRCILIVMGLGLVGSGAYAQAPGEVPIAPLQEPAQSQQQASMSLDAGTMAGQAVIGGLFGLGGAVLGGYTAYAARCNSDCDDDDGAVLVVLGGAVLGGSLAMAGGIKLVGDNSKIEGSYLGTAAGSMLGGLVGILAIAKIENHDDGDNAGLDLAVLSASWLTGGMVGYYATRSWKHSDVKLTPLVAPQVHGGVTFGVGGSF